MRRFFRPALLLLLLIGFCFASHDLLAQRRAYSGGEDNEKVAKNKPATKLATRFRRPVALAFSDDQNWLYAANRDGSISVVDLKKQQVVGEHAVGKQLSDLIALPKSNILLATDQAAHELLLLKAEGQRITVTQRLKVNSYPVGVVATRDRRRCYVTSLWSRRLTFIDLPEGKPAQVSDTLDMPYAPRKQLLVRDDKKLIVADSFGGKLGIVDTDTRKLTVIREVPGHNIRGLGVSGDGSMLLVAHQMLNELAHTVRNDVHWGLLMSNDLRWLRLDAVLDPKADLYKGAHMHPLGEAGSATADPGALAVAPDSTVVVTLSGVDEISLGREKDFSLYRLGAGKRPTAVVIRADSRRAFIANTFSDSVSVIDLVNRETVLEILLGPPIKLSSAERGELLFHDGMLSHDGWMSCQSCHTNGHTNSMLNDNFSDKSFGAPKRVLSLLGKSGTEPLAWSGGSQSFPEQIRKSIVNTMQSDKEPSDRQVTDIAAYLETLISPPSIDQARGTVDEKAISRGSALFGSLNCNRCHAPPTYTTPKLYNVGLSDKLGNKRFNPPSLRGVGQRGPYFHEGQAKTLNEVFRKFRHKLPRDLTDDELRDLTSFLRSL